MSMACFTGEKGFSILMPPEAMLFSNERIWVHPLAIEAQLIENARWRLHSQNLFDTCKSPVHVQLFPDCARVVPIGRPNEPRSKFDAELSNSTDGRRYDHVARCVTQSWKATGPLVSRSVTTRLLKYQHGGNGRSYPEHPLLAPVCCELVEQQHGSDSGEDSKQHLRKIMR
jgi:hypothetical protein